MIDFDLHWALFKKIGNFRQIKKGSSTIDDHPNLNAPSSRRIETLQNGLTKSIKFKNISFDLDGLLRGFDGREHGFKISLFIMIDFFFGPLHKRPSW